MGFEGNRLRQLCCRSRAAARSRMAASGRPASMHVDDYERNPAPKESPGKGAAGMGAAGANVDASRLQDPSYIAVRLSMFDRNV